MLGSAPFYHKHFRKYVAAFGTLFNDISIVREDRLGNEKTIQVPLAYARKDKSLMRLREDPELRNTWNKTLPRMAFNMNMPMYAPERKQNTMNYSKRAVDGSVSSMQFSPAPYDIDFDLSIWVQYYEDGLQIVEQILPFFQPEYVIKVKEVPELGLDRDVHVVLNSSSLDDSSEGSFEDTRIIEWTLNFTLKGFFYGPVEDQSIIKKTLAEIFFEPEFEYAAVRYTSEVVPLTAGIDDPHEIINTTEEI